MNVDFDVEQLLQEANANDLDSLLSSVEDIEAKRIVFMESLIVVHANEDFDDVQHDIVGTMRREFRVDRKLYTLMTEWAKSILSLHKQGTALINI